MYKVFIFHEILRTGRVKRCKRLTDIKRLLVQSPAVTCSLSFPPIKPSLPPARFFITHITTCAKSLQCTRILHYAVRLHRIFVSGPSCMHDPRRWVSEVSRLTSAPPFVSPLVYLLLFCPVGLYVIYICPFCDHADHCNQTKGFGISACTSNMHVKRTLVAKFRGLTEAVAVDAKDTARHCQTCYSAAYFHI